MTEQVGIVGTSSMTVQGPHGRAYRVLLGEPQGAGPREGFPLVCVLDADRLFALTLDAIRFRSGRPDATGIGPAVVVGVAPAGSGEDARRVRRLDFTPEGTEAAVRQDDVAPARGAQAQGAELFRQFLEDVVVPAAARRYPVDVRHVVLLGHSLAGLFVLATLAAPVSTFTGFVAISPSLWSAPSLVAALPRLLRQRIGRTARVAISVGEYEQRQAPWQPSGTMTDDALARRDARRMVDHVHALGESLRGIPSLGVDVHEFEGEDHASVVLPSLARSLRLVLPPACHTLMPLTSAPATSGAITA